MSSGHRIAQNAGVNGAPRVNIGQGHQRRQSQKFSKFLVTDLAYVSH